MGKGYILGYASVWVGAVRLRNELKRLKYDRPTNQPTNRRTDKATKNTCKIKHKYMICRDSVVCLKESKVLEGMQTETSPIGQLDASSA